jgi:hypothetical protein
MVGLLASPARPDEPRAKKPGVVPARLNIYED